MERRVGGGVGGVGVAAILERLARDERGAIDLERERALDAPRDEVVPPRGLLRVDRGGGVARRRDDDEKSLGSDDGDDRRRAVAAATRREEEEDDDARDSAREAAAAASGATLATAVATVILSPARVKVRRERARAS